MSIKFTPEQLKAILARNPDAGIWLNDVNIMLEKYKINTPQRVAGFFSQTCVESLDFTVMAENLNYSEKGLNAVFSKYFAKAGRNAAEYARQPEKIANVVYADRMGNGNTASGEGYLYRGRGLIQLTGKNNYQAFATAVGMSLKEVISYLETPKGALESACWFWSSNKLNDIADKGDIVKLSKRVNGGTNGLEHRKHKYEEVLHLLGAEFDPAEILEVHTCKKGDKGPHVAKIQAKLGIPADGHFGPTTLMHVKKFQSKNGLTADGIVGPMTYKALFT